MVFGGDIVLGNSFLAGDIPASWDSRYFSGIRSTLQQADLAFGNFEGTLTDRKKTLKTPGRGRQFAFRSPPHYAQLMRREGFTVVNMANNHAFDFMEEGHLDTLENFKKAGIVTTGLRGQITTLQVRGMHIALVGFTYSSRFNSVFDIEGAAKLVHEARARAGFVIATFHAGAEGSAAIWHDDANEIFMGEERGNTVAFARAMIDAGADLVVGHGPHVLRAAECYRDHPIFYSLGNFVGVGGLSIRKMAALSALLNVEISSDGGIQSLDIIPLRFDDQKLPQPDPRAFGTHLINHLGRNARYSGQFIEFSTDKGEEAAFQAWFKTNSE